MVLSGEQMTAGTIVMALAMVAVVFFNGWQDRKYTSSSWYLAVLLTSSMIALGPWPLPRWLLITASIAAGISAAFALRWLNRKYPPEKE